MSQFTGRVTVYESTDGGSGKPADTFWQFRVANRLEFVDVRTVNYLHAETMRFAMETAREVRVSYQESESGKTMNQARLEDKPAPPLNSKSRTKSRKKRRKSR